MLPRTVFGAYKNATARRNHSMKKKEKESAEKLFVRIEKAVNHPDSCFLNKKQRKQLTSMCLQHLQPLQQQQKSRSSINSGRGSGSRRTSSSERVENHSVESRIGSEGLKVTLLQRVQEANLMHHLQNSRAAEILLQKHSLLEAAWMHCGGDKCQMQL